VDFGLNARKTAQEVKGLQRRCIALYEKFVAKLLRSITCHMRSQYHLPLKAGERAPF